MINYIIVVLLAIYKSKGDQDFRSELGSRPGSPNDPGVQARISEKGVNYMGQTSADLLREGVRRFRFPKIPVALPLGGSAIIHDIRVTNFKPADAYSFRLVSPNKAKYRAENMDLTVEGDAEGHVNNIYDEAHGVVTLSGVTLDAAVDVTRDGGYPRLTVTDCLIHIQSMKMNLDGMSHRGIQNIINKNGKLIQDKVRPSLEQNGCIAFQKFINEKFNSELKKEPLKMLIIKPNTPLPAQLTSSGFGRRLASDVLQKMTFDRSLTKDPEFNANTGDFYLRGECAINGQGGTPFGPMALNDNTFPRKLRVKAIPTETDVFTVELEDKRNLEGMSKCRCIGIAMVGSQTSHFHLQTTTANLLQVLRYVNANNSTFLLRTAASKMLYVTVSDFVLNSFLYSAYKTGALTINLNKAEMPDYAKFLRTSCNEASGEICIGSVLPQVAKDYPNADFRIQLKPVKAPAIVVSNGKATGYLDSVATLYASDKQLADMDLNAQVEMTPTIDNNMLKGKVDVKSLTGKLRSSNVKEIDQSKIDQWTSMASSILEVLANDQLQKGFPIPQNRFVKMQNAQLNLSDRRLRVETDLQADISNIIDAMQSYADQQGANLLGDAAARRQQGSNRNREKRRKQRRRLTEERRSRL